MNDMPTEGPYRLLDYGLAYREDFFLDWVGLQPNWTKDPLPDPCYSLHPVYTGGVRNGVTGEWSGGQWLDPHAPTPTQEAETQFSIKRIHLTSLIQAVLDDFARTGGYDSILSLCTYATSSVEKFRVEGQYGVDLRDQCWMTGYAVLADIAAGLRDWPTDEEAIAMMPPLIWPEV